MVDVFLRLKCLKCNAEVRASVFDECRLGTFLKLHRGHRIVNPDRLSSPQARARQYRQRALVLVKRLRAMRQVVSELRATQVYCGFCGGATVMHVCELCRAVIKEGESTWTPGTVQP